jgi:hypothetical protein
MVLVPFPPHASIMLLLLTEGNQNAQHWGILKWHKIHLKFHETIFQLILKWGGDRREREGHRHTNLVRLLFSLRQRK